MFGFGDGILDDGGDVFEWKFRKFDVGSFDVDSKEHGVCLMMRLVVKRLR